MDNDNSNTEVKQKKSPIPGAKPFVKGDPRINRKGRPKAFDYIRAIGQQIGQEIVTESKDGKQIRMNAARAALWKLFKHDPYRFIAIAFGEPPKNVQITGAGGGPVQVDVSSAFDEEYRKRQGSKTKNE